MTSQLEGFKAKGLSTVYPRWRRVLSSVVLGVLATSIVLAWWYSFFTLEDTSCHRGFLYFSIVWLAVQWVVLGFLLAFETIPRFARGAIVLLILLGNIWFGLFLFSLQPCGG